MARKNGPFLAREHTRSVLRLQADAVPRRTRSFSGRGVCPYPGTAADENLGAGELVRPPHMRTLLRPRHAPFASLRWKIPSRYLSLLEGRASGADDCEMAGGCGDDAAEPPGAEVQGRAQKPAFTKAGREPQFLKWEGSWNAVLFTRGFDHQTSRAVATIKFPPTAHPGRRGNELPLPSLASPSRPSSFHPAPAGIL